MYILSDGLQLTGIDILVNTYLVTFTLAKFRTNLSRYATTCSGIRVVDRIP